MRPLIALALLLAASPALAQSQGALRGTVDAPPPAQAPPAPLYSPIIPPPALTAGAAGQCRLSCAQSYYFCLAGEDPGDCGTTWGQCRSQCDAPSPAPANAYATTG